MNPSLKRQLLKTFSQMVDDFSDPREIEIFLTDFFDDIELEKYIKRMMIAYWLKKGRDNENIKGNLKASSKEISEAQKFLRSEGGKLAIKKIEAEEFANVWAERIQKVLRK